MAILELPEILTARKLTAMQEDDDYLVTCAGCSRPIFTGDNILVLDFNADTPASLVHLELDCLLGMQEISCGTLGSGTTCNTSMLNRTSRLTRIK